MEHAGPVIVTRDVDLRGDLQRLCAAASVTPEVVDDPDLARRPWATASCVLVGDDCAAEVTALELGRRPDVVLVTHAPETPDAWRRGISLKADHVAVLPDSQSWIVDRLTETRDRGAVDALVVGTVGACGGAGASTLAAMLAVSVARRGGSALLVDADPLGGGLELVVGCEDVPGLRWPEVVGTDGRVSPAALRSVLPTYDGVAVLSARQSTPFAATATAVRPIVTAARRGFDVVVVDVGRRVDPDALTVVAALDAVLLVATPDVRAAAAGAQLAPALQTACPAVSLVVRSRRGSQLQPGDVAASIALPLAGEVVTRRALHRAVDDGLGPLLMRGDRRRLDALISSIEAARRRRVAR
jgi:secretion/DNA translocation related CpaE-like protein